MSEPAGWLVLFDDELEDAARQAFAEAFDLQTITWPTYWPIQPLHQELRLALRLWHETTVAGIAWHTPIAQLVGRDHLALARDANGQTRIVRVVS